MKCLKKKNAVFAIVIAALLAAPAFPQNILINEFMSSNSTAIADEDGDFSDWIELYNAGTESVNLAGWGLSDDTEQPYRWVFPEVIIESGEYLLVWASGKDRKPDDEAPEPKSPDQLAGLVGWYAADSLSLANGQSVEEWPDLSSKGNHAVQVNAANRPVFSAAAINGCGAVSFDRSQVQFLNLPTAGFSGLENFENLTVISVIRWGGVATSGIFGGFGRTYNSGNTHFEIQSGGNLRLRIGSNDSLTVTGAVSQNEWNAFAAEQQTTSENSFSRLRRNGEILGERHQDPGVVDTADYDNICLGSSYPDRTLDGLMAETIIYNRMLMDAERLSVQAWLSGKYALPFVDAPSSEFHTNFSIKSEGEPLQLTRADGTVADTVTPQVLLGDLSYGRATDGAAEWHYYQGGTPGSSNDALTGYTSFLTAPEFSAAGGFFDAEFYLTLSNADPEATVYYTLDGSEPTAASPVYTGPLLMRVRHGDQNLVANIETTPAFDPAGVDGDFVAQQLLPAITWMPPGLVKKATVVRAKAVKTGALTSSTETKTYWVDPQIQTRFTLPVVSISTDASNFFNPHRDAETGGIYVRGSQYVNSNPGRPWHSSPANYKEKWERPVHVSFYGADGELWFSQNAGVRIHGGATRALQQKTLRLYARGDYGDGSFSYPIFEDEPHTSYKRLLLRNSGNDWNLTLFRDAISQGVSRHMRCDTMAYRPAVMFLNGEYWGIHNIRERYDKYYLEKTYDVDPENLDFLDKGAVAEGDKNHYNALSNFINNNDMANASNFAYVETQMDTEQFIDYFIAEIFARNTDWPWGNIACWRLRVPYDPDLPYGHDGRWRWLMYDVEHGFGYRDLPDYGFNMLPHARNHAFFNRLLYNTGFRNRFINRFADQLNTAYLPDRIMGMIDDMKAGIEPEMPHHIERWLRPASLSEWDQKIQPMRDFATYRADAVRGHLRSHFGLGADQTLTLNVSDALHGHVRVNRTDINAQTPGVNAATPYPWTGLYYSTVPITLTAVPYEGYWFSHWQTSGGGTYSTQPALSVTLTGSLSLTAVFVQAPQTYLMHYWSFNTTTALTQPVYTIGGASMSIVPAASTVVTSDTEEGFAGANCRIEEPVGPHLRMNYPIGASMVISLPTTGYEANVLRYETRRSGSGAGQQMIAYSTDGNLFTPLQTINVADADPVLQVIDLTGLAGVDNNPSFQIRIQFAQGAGGTAGNNRFDNLTLDGTPMTGTNTPPQVIEPIGLQETIEEDSPIQIELSHYFSDDGPLSYDVVAEKPVIATTSLAGSTLTVNPLQRGETRIQATVSDGVNPPAKTTFRLLVYPKAQPLRLGPVTFDYWSANEPDDKYPDHFLFLQTNVSDPGLNEPLEYAYFIPHDDYHADDQATIGYPYNNTGRTRINGLWDNGISFINTGRGRDLGGALTAIDTTGLDSARLSWLAGTVLTNDRPYAIRLQYRVGHTGAFTDFLVGGSPVEYLVQYNFHTQNFGPLDLPGELMNQEYVQLLWRYYYVGGTSGPRAQLRFDDIVVSGRLDMFEQFGLFAEWWLRSDCAPPDYCEKADLTRDGRVDLEDFAVLSMAWLESTD